MKVGRRLGDLVDWLSENEPDLSVRVVADTVNGGWIMRVDGSAWHLRHVPGDELVIALVDKMKAEARAAEAARSLSDDQISESRRLAAACFDESPDDVERWLIRQRQAAGFDVP